MKPQKRPDPPRKSPVRTPIRSRTPSKAQDPDPPFEHAVTNLRSKLQTLEEKYSYFMQHYGAQLQDQRSRKQAPSEDSTPVSEERRGRTGTSSPMRAGRPREPELAAILAPVIEETREKVLSLVRGEAREEVEEQFIRLQIGLQDSLQRAKWRTEPGQAKEWVRKLLRLEEEKRTLEAKHRDYIETLSKRMMAKNDEYQREIARLQRENSLLTSSLTPLKRSTVSSPKSRPITRAITPDLESGSLRTRQRTPDKRDGSPIQRSVSPVERKIQGLKTELEGTKQKLDSAEYEADLLRAWKDSYTKNPPDYADMVHHHHSESEYERKQVLTKLQALQHQQKALLLSLQRFVRLGSALTKSCRDRDAIVRFEDARADLELQVRDIGKEEGLKDQPDAFAEMLSLIQREVQAAGGADISPAAFIAQQSHTLSQLKQQLLDLQQVAEQARKETKLTQDKQQVERMTIQRLSEELEDMRRVRPARQDPSRALKTLASELSQQLDLITKLLLECVNRRSGQVQALSTRLSSLKSRYIENSHSIGELRKSNSVLTLSVNVFQKENKDLKAGNQQQKAQLIAKEAELRELVEEIQAIEADNQSLQLELAANCSRAPGRDQELESLLQETRKTLENERNEAKSLKIKLNSSETEAISLKDQLESQQSKQTIESNELKSAYKTLQEELRSAKLQVQELKRAEQQRVAGIQALELDNSAIKAQMERVRASSEEEAREWAKRLETAKSELRKTLKEAENQAEAYKLQRDSFADRIAPLESDLSVLRRLSEDAESDKSRLVSANSRLESKLNAANERETELQQACAQLKLDNQRQATELADIKSQRQSLLSDLRTAEKHAEKVNIIDALQLQLTSQGQEIQRLREKEDEGWKEKDRLETALRDAVRTANKAGLQCARWKRLGCGVKDVVGECRELLGTVRTAAVEFNRSGKDVSSAVLKTLGRLTELQTKQEAGHTGLLRRAQGEKAALESSLEALKRQTEESSRKLQAAKTQAEFDFDAFRSDSEAKIRSLELELATIRSLRDTESAKAKENADSLKKRLEAVTKDQENRGNALMEAENKLQSSLEERENALNQVKTAKTECKDLQARLQATEQQLVTANEANWRLESALETQKGEIEALNQQLSLTLASKSDSETALSGLKTQIQAIEAASKRQFAAVTDKESAISALNAELQAEKLRLAAVQQEKAALASQVEALELRCATLAQGSDSGAKETAFLRRQIEELEANIAKLKQNAGDLEGKLTNSIRENHSIASILADSQKNAISLQQSIDSKEAQVQSLSAELASSQKQAKSASDLQFQSTEQAIALEDKVSVLEKALKEAKSEVETLKRQVEVLTSDLEKAQKETKSAVNTASQLEMALTLESQTVDSLKQLKSTLESEVAGLKEDLQKGAVEAVLSESDQSGHLEIVKEGEVVEDFAAAELRAEVEVMAAGAELEDSQLEELREVLSGYPNSDMVHTVRQLLGELAVYKRSKTGVVIPKLQLPTLHTSLGVQTSPLSARSLSFAAASEEEKSSERQGDSPHQSKSVILATLQDQDTPRSKAFPELWRSRASSELKQVKTEEIYSLHNRIRGLEKDVTEETKIREHLERQVLVLKEELKEKDRTIRRMAVTESAGEKSPVNVEHLKDLVVKLIMQVPEL